MIRASFVLRHAAPLIAYALAACGGSSAAPPTTPTATTVTITPPAAAIVFGALGRTVQLNVTGTTAGAVPVTNASVTWSSTVPAVATVSGTGLVTAVVNGATAITASFGGVTSASVPIAVNQVVASITVSSTSATPDTLFTATRTRQFSAVGKDSTNNTITSPAFAWTSSAGTVASVNAGTGLVAAGATSGSTSIQAAVGAINASRPIVVRHFPATFTVAPTSSTITTSSGTRGFAGTAQDSVGTNLSITWLSRSPAFATVSPATGAATTATAVANGTTYIVLSSGVRTDSAALVVSGQGAAPATVAVSVGDVFFTSVRNTTTNPATDTLAVGGTATWTWAGGSHSVSSSSGSSFTSSTIKSGAGQSYVFTFGVVGTYNYICAVHGASMSGTLVVR